MADDDRRVEPKRLFVGSGYGTTPERIAEIQRRQVEMEKIRRPEPAQPFSSVLAAKVTERAEEVEPDPEEVLPKGPRPGLSHPAQREVFGRLEEAEDSIIIKG